MTWTPLSRMRALATGLLALMAIVYVGCRRFEDQLPWLEWPGAFAEAAMVGALADWFAVVALFRRPLGFPWHTAIIPRKKDQIGDSLADFVQTNFLSPERIVDKLRNIDLPGRLAEWLAQDENSSRAAARLTESLPGLLDAIGDEDMQRFVRENFVAHAGQLPLAPIAGKVLGLLVENNHHHEFFDQTLTLGRHLVAENQPLIRRKIRESLGEMPTDLLHPLKEGVAEAAANWAVDKIQRTLDEVAADPRHELRLQFERKARAFVRDLQDSPELAHKADELRDRLLAHDGLQSSLNALWQGIKNHIREDCARPDSMVRRRLGDLVRSLGEGLRKDKAFQTKLDLWLAEGASRLLGRHGHEIGNMIRETVRSWDGREIAAKIERQVGSDLQFIRINGTLVGGLVGLFLHLLSVLFAL